MRTARQTIEGMTLAFDPASAGDLEATVQFDISGDQPGACYLLIAEGRCSFHLGRAQEPNLTIVSSPDVWQRVSDGRLSGRDALLDGLYEARGDLGLLLRFDQLFRRPHEVSHDAPPGQRPAGPIALSGMSWLFVAFVPWILMWLDLERLGLSGQHTTLLPLAFSASLVAYRSSVGELTWFEAGTLAYCIAFSLAAFVAEGWSEHWEFPVSMVVLGAIWLAPEALGREPLSAAYSKWRYRRELWDHSTFVHVNAVICLVWGWVFVAQALVGALAHQVPERASELRFLQFLLLAPAVLVSVGLPRRATTMRIADPEAARAGFRIAAVAGLLIAGAATFYLLSR